jgi:magnesium chelatase family protein
MAAQASDETVQPQAAAGRRPETPRQLHNYCRLKPKATSILKVEVKTLSLSARAHDKVLRVARTIADLEASDEIKPQHIAEAVGYRSLDRSVWM